jgi:hypothetical protein
MLVALLRHWRFLTHGPETSRPSGVFGSLIQTVASGAPAPKQEFRLHPSTSPSPFSHPLRASIPTTFSDDSTQLMQS